MPRKAEIKSLLYITHIENVPSILTNGILSHELVEARNIPFTPFYDAGIVGNRKNKSTPERASLWEYANVYFQPRNPMMYRVVHEKAPKDLAVIGVKPSVLQLPHVMLTDGNAANHPTRFFTAANGLKVIEEQWPVIQAEYWNDLDGSKRKIMAECLVPERIPAEHVHTVFVADHDAKNRVLELIGASKVPVVPEPNFFFKPYFAARVGENISLVEGDMFFSGMQTLTVSVNLQGIMGKGLASRAKYQFPDVYVFYRWLFRAELAGRWARSGDRRHEWRFEFRSVIKDCFLGEAPRRTGTSKLRRQLSTPRVGRSTPQRAGRSAMQRASEPCRQAKEYALPAVPRQ